jgi:hypothetical protein|tara:strand:+ start:334 stop:537 length:204 start_codon:yes stop_codon:yes gene_type:complete
MLSNPARELYSNMDIENLEPMKKEESKGLLSKPMSSNISKTASKEPAFRVAQHMLIIRKQREMLKNG